ncbi:MAG: hypothetical protein DCF22_14910 [Leptolyngbya sp.]|nr:MAG: hypothetical protein DCF22_14910 [Leptolyngbya sp.]
MPVANRGLGKPSSKSSSSSRSSSSRSSSSRSSSSRSSSSSSSKSRISSARISFNTSASASNGFSALALEEIAGKESFAMGKSNSLSSSSSEGFCDRRFRIGPLFRSGSFSAGGCSIGSILVCSTDSSWTNSVVGCS